ncbi:unnamed protein product, partial [Ectocarpus fasciculatus]
VERSEHSPQRGPRYWPQGGSGGRTASPDTRHRSEYAAASASRGAAGYSVAGGHGRRGFFPTNAHAGPDDSGSGSGKGSGTGVPSRKEGGEWGHHERPQHPHYRSEYHHQHYQYHQLQRHSGGGMPMAHHARMLRAGPPAHVRPSSSSSSSSARRAPSTHPWMMAGGGRGGGVHRLEDYSRVVMGPVASPPRVVSSHVDGPMAIVEVAGGGDATGRGGYGRSGAAAAVAAAEEPYGFYVGAKNKGRGWASA